MQGNNKHKHFERAKTSTSKHKLNKTKMVNKWVNIGKNAGSCSKLIVELGVFIF